LAKQVVGAADVVRNFLGGRNEADVFLQRLDSLRQALRFAVYFTKVKIHTRFLGVQALGV
jgi:hypothetical protein